MHCPASLITIIVVSLLTAGRKREVVGILGVAIFVARLDQNENEVTIKRHLDSTLKLDVTVELCKQSI